MFDKLRQIESRYAELSARLAETANAPGGRAEYARLAKAAAEIEPVVTAFGQYKNILARIEEANHILGEDGDAELRELASLELEELRAREQDLEERLQGMLLPRDARDDKNVLVEIRAGAGGDEAALFAADLARMYTKYAERHGLRVEVLDTPPHRPRRLQGVHPVRSGQGRLEPAQVRARSAPGPAGPRNGVRRPHPHLDGDRRGPCRRRRTSTSRSRRRTSR